MIVAMRKKPSSPPDRKDRLARALKANLHKRKAQARGRKAPAKPAGN